MLTDVLLGHPQLTPAALVAIVLVGPSAGAWLAHRRTAARVLTAASLLVVVVLTLTPSGRTGVVRCAVQWSLPTPGRVEVLANVVLLVAPALLLTVASRRPVATLLGGSALSVGVEAVQALVPPIGRSCDTTDWLANTIGAGIGVLLGVVALAIARQPVRQVTGSGRARWRALPEPSILSRAHDPVLLCDPRVAAVPVRECGEPLVRLSSDFGQARALVRSGLADRLEAARRALPPGIGLRVVEGYRSVDDQRVIIYRYAGEVRAAHPRAGDAEVRRLTARFVSPVAVAPHVAGAAVDLTLVDAAGVDLDLGTSIDATPEQSAGRCCTAARGIGARARAHRELMVEVLGGAGLVNYPTEWWHWSHGDRYWALTTGAAAATYGPVDVAVRA